MFTKCAIDGDEDGKLDKKLGEMKIDLDENYKKMLLDETRLRAASKKAAKPEEKKEGAGKKKKHKKKKLPKNADKNIPVDPERWMPKWKRAKYRKRFGRKQRETQGEATGTTQVGACIININSTYSILNRSSWTKHSNSRSIQA